MNAGEDAKIAAVVESALLRNVGVDVLDLEVVNEPVVWNDLVRLDGQERKGRCDDLFFRNRSEILPAAPGEATQGILVMVPAHDTRRMGALIT